MYKGIYWPGLTNSFHHKHLEVAYLRYSHRQRQKALIMVNVVDLLLKVSNYYCNLYSLNNKFECAFIKRRFKTFLSRNV